MDSTALALILAGFGFALILLSHRRQVQHRIWSAVGHGVAGAVIFLAGVLLLVVALNLDTYERLQTGQPVAQLSIEKTGPLSYRVSLMRIPSGDLQVFNLNGDRWSVQARRLDWDGMPRWLGLHTDIRLQQLQSSGGDADKTDVATTYKLSRNPGMDVWVLRLRHPHTVPRWLTLHSLSSEAMPLVDGLRYHLYLTETALAARVINKRGEAGVSAASVPAASAIHNAPARSADLPGAHP